MGMRQYVVLDIETTGLSKYKHKITEIAAVKFKYGKQVDEFSNLVNPQMPIPRFITRLTGINNDMVKKAPTINKILPGFLNFLGNDMLVAHNATFDYGFISYNAKEHLNHVMMNDRICTRKLASRLLPELPSKKLSSICEFLEISNLSAHRAMSDVIATSNVFSTFLSMMRENGIRKPHEIIKFESMPLSRIRSKLTVMR